MGKVKIPIKKIENPNARQVCFSKRRMSIFKKASELSIMFGAKIAIIVYSPAGKAFTFGSPDIDFVVDKYQNIPVHINEKKV
uniref:MADS-box protein 41 n=1 Tax=Cunninghamia lanceolata TaxID=28977 RepID=A0A8F3BYJ3_CUNLA|nr:MADS-box protein 41 [Cunninghamia lanceolata]